MRAKRTYFKISKILKSPNNNEVIFKFAENLKRHERSERIFKTQSFENILKIFEIFNL